MEFEIELSRKSEKTPDIMKKRDSNRFEIVIDTLKRLERNPEYFGKPLTGDLKGLWSLRIGDYRVIYQIIFGIIANRTNILFKTFEIRGSSCDRFSKAS